MVLIPTLPKEHLLAQHRECCALRGKGWGRKHSVVDYVFRHSRERLFAYHTMVMDETARRPLLRTQSAAERDVEARPDHFAAFVESTVGGIDTETVMRLHGMSRDNIYQIRARFTAKLKTFVATICAEMDEGRFGFA